MRILTKEMKTFLKQWAAGAALSLVLMLYLMMFHLSDLDWYLTVPAGAMLRYLAFASLTLLDVALLLGLAFAAFLAARRDVRDGNRRWYRRFSWEVPALLFCLGLGWVQVNYLTPAAQRPVYELHFISNLRSGYLEALHDEFLSDFMSTFDKWGKGSSTPQLAVQIAAAERAAADGDIEAEKTLQYLYQEAEKRHPHYVWLLCYPAALLAGAFEGLGARWRKKRRGESADSVRPRGRWTRRRWIRLSLCGIGVLAAFYYQLGVQHWVKVSLQPYDSPIVLRANLDKRSAVSVRFFWRLSCSSRSLQPLCLKHCSIGGDEWEKTLGKWQGTSALLFVEEADTLRWFDQGKDDCIAPFKTKDYVVAGNYLLRRDSAVQALFRPYVERMCQQGKDTLHLTFLQLGAVADSLLYGDELRPSFRYHGSKSGGISLPFGK